VKFIVRPRLIRLLIKGFKIISSLLFDDNNIIFTVDITFICKQFDKHNQQYDNIVTLQVNIDGDTNKYIFVQ